MKKSILIIGLLAFLSFSTISCYDSSLDDPKDVEMVYSAYKNSLTTERWTISKYLVGDSDHTDEIKDYTLRFKTDNTLELEGFGETHIGSWEMDPSVASVQDFILEMNFPSTAPTAFAVNLDTVWNMRQVSAHEIVLTRGTRTITMKKVDEGQF